MDRCTSQNTKAKPFLRWIGGKTRLLSFLRPLVPDDINDGTYWEPFLGAGSLFFSLCPHRAVLSDSNPDLIACFRAVRDRPELISKYLRTYGPRSSEDYYYNVRAEYNRSRDSFAKSAKFIYLNKTCFNGIWRVNEEGQFNVPYGRKEPPLLPSSRDLRYASSALRRARIDVGDFREVLKDAEPGDFIYLDPPYPPLNKTAYFTHYTQERFYDDDQVAVAKIAQQLHERGCRVLISNADTKYIRSLYNGFRVLGRSVTRWIRTDGTRYKAREIAILNYNNDRYW